MNRLPLADSRYQTELLFNLSFVSIFNLFVSDQTYHLLVSSKDNQEGNNQFKLGLALGYASR